MAPCGKIIDVKSEVLGTVVSPRLSEETPVVLSVGRRCIDDGWTFVWPGYGNPYFQKPDGDRIELQVDNDVPLLQEPSSDYAATADAVATPASGSGGHAVPVPPPPSAPNVEDRAASGDEDEPPALINESGEDEIAEQVPNQTLAKSGEVVRGRKAEASRFKQLMTHLPKHDYCHSLPAG